MTRISEDMLRRRAEHNEGMVSTLEEVALHQQNIEKIENLGKLCPHLKILYMQNNLIGKLENLHKLKELEYLNMAVNNVAKLQNLQRCESLVKLDLTINFIPKSGLLSIPSLQYNIHLEDLYLLGNPCTDWEGYRQFVIAKLPRLKKLDGTEIKHSERIAALQVVDELEAKLCAELRAEGIDPVEAASVEDDGGELDMDEEILETGTMGEDGEMRRPWSAATRILEHRETERQNREAEERKNAGSKTDKILEGPTVPPRHEDFPPLPDSGERIMQRNEGKWDFSIDESEDGLSVVLEVAVGKYVDTSLVKADVQPSFVRLLIKGRLLQLVLPCEVKPDASNAQRSNASGNLQLTMPKENPWDKHVDVSHIRPAQGNGKPTRTSTVSPAVTKEAAAANAQKSKTTTTTTSIHNIVKGSGGNEFVMREVRKAAVHAVAEEEEEDDDYIPPL